MPRDASAAPRRRSSGRHERGSRARERERQLLDAARAQFAARGYARVTMDEVAAAVGVTKPLLYTYFGNKEQLYLACMEPAAEALTAAVLAAVERRRTPAEALHGGVHAFFAFVDEERGAWRILFDETLPAGGEVARRVAGTASGSPG